MNAHRGDASRTGQRVGSYEVRELIGAGGMGDVYRAHDSLLGREVAIKVVSDAFAENAERLARFEREARILATLNHPHIGAIYGVEEVDGLRALVLELVEGDTLADRLLGGRLPIDEALAIARQIADALEAAHEKGIVHRDLKPSNIKITPDGVVKVLDFGLSTFEGEGALLTHGVQSTITLGGTREGVILGTAAYMSPEQARGRPVDKRTDIWAFGCVLFEMLSGQKVFSGETLSDTVAAILERHPDWTRLPPSTPAAVRRLLERCLERDAKHRLRDIGDARIELERIASASVTPPLAVARPAPPRKHARIIAAAAAVAVALGAGVYWRWFFDRNVAAGDRRVTRFVIAMPEEQAVFSGFNSDLALAPDGRQLAFASVGGVFIRRLDRIESRRLEASTSYAGGPLFSPDGTSISYIDGNAILSSRRPFLKAALSGGIAVKLADYDMFHTGDWGGDGWIYWTARYPGGIVRIRESGGSLAPVTALDAASGERSHRFAKLLPGGQAMIYTVGAEGMDSYDEGRIDLFDLRTRQKKTLIAGGTSAVYVSSGHIVFARAGKLAAVPFDLARREVTGPPFDAVDSVMMSPTTGAAQFAVSHSGDLAYIPGPGEAGQRTLVWVDRAGKAEPLPLPPAAYLYPRLSPDGRFLAVEIEGPNHDVYVYDFARGVLSNMTTDGLSHSPVWSPDGRRLAFRSWQAGGMTMWLMPFDRSAPAVRLDPAGSRQNPVSFSPDGRFVAFDQKDPQTQDDAWVLPIDGRSEPRPLANSRHQEGSAKFSPDGRWVAYASTESGRPEIYVQAFPGPGPKVQISNEGGTDPVWVHSGDELMYRSRDRMMTVSVRTAPEFRGSAPRQLWEGKYSRGAAASCGMPGVSSSNYDVTRDGRRFLMVRDDDALRMADQIVIVLNFAEELKAKDPARSESTGR